MTLLVKSLFPFPLQIAHVLMKQKKLRRWSVITTCLKMVDYLLHGRKHAVDEVEQMSLSNNKHLMYHGYYHFVHAFIIEWTGIQQSMAGVNWKRVRSTALEHVCQPHDLKTAFLLVTQSTSALCWNAAALLVAVVRCSVIGVAQFFSC